MDDLLITGDTYPVRNYLRELGCVWRPGPRLWEAPSAAVAVQARERVAKGPGISGGHSASRPSRPKYRSNYARFSSGAEVYTNKRGRCEDAPCCGCCS